MAVPDRVGRYRIVRLLGRGGSSSVFLAHDPDFDAEVAIKVLAENLVCREDVVARFLAQARTLRAVNDPHVIGVHDVGVLDNGQPYFVMDAAPGPPLAEVDGLDVPQLAESVAALHAHGVVHGDLTPANVFVAGDGRLVLADPGADGIGTPGYMAPEQERGDPIDERTDVYACTALVRRRVPRRSLKRFIARGLASDPDARPADMHAWLADYQRAARTRWLMPAGLAVLVLAALAILGALFATSGGDDAERPVYVADPARHQVTRDGVVFAGTGVAGDDGEGVRAVDAQLNAPRAVVEAADGVVYIADTANNRVRAVRDGIITTVAGTGADGTAGDNDLAKDAQLSAPRAIDVLPDGRVLVASGPRLRAFTPGGNITAFAGGTDAGSTDGPADQARFSRIEQIDVRDGSVYVIDNGRTRVVAPDGSVTTSAP
jgi:hypothetical protein